MTDDQKQTYNSICFTDLAYEFDFSDKKEIEKKIKRRLKYHKLGDYRQDRVDYIRELKNDLQNEISKTTKSKYFQKSKSNYADLADFDIERMTDDYHRNYDQVTKAELKGMIGFAIYLYHMR
ncbi:MAG: hypothetical protein HWE14_13440 [Flavobacteriia bacterium]|nr:hypothetical protein [Flavobacteriia bacterium]